MLISGLKPTLYAAVTTARSATVFTKADRAVTADRAPDLSRIAMDNKSRLFPSRLFEFNVDWGCMCRLIKDCAGDEQQGDQ